VPYPAMFQHPPVLREELRRTQPAPPPGCSALHLQDGTAHRVRGEDRKL